MAVAIQNEPTKANVMSSLTTEDGFTVESNYETPAQLRKGMGYELDDTSEKSAESATPPAAEATATPEPQAPQPSRRKQSRHENARVRVESATAQAAESQRLLDEQRKENERLTAQIAELQKPKLQPVAPAGTVMSPPSQVAQPASYQPPPQLAAAPPTQAEWQVYAGMPDAPKIEEFSNIQDYQFAVGLFITDKRLEQREYTQRVAAQQVPFRQRMEAEMQKDPSFLTKLQQTPFDEQIMPYVHNHPMGPDIMVFLANNQPIAQRLATLHPIEQIGKIGEIVASLKAPVAAAPSTAPARPAISQAKPPTQRVSGAPPAPADEELGDDASDEQWDARYGPLRRQHSSVFSRRRATR